MSFALFLVICTAVTGAVALVDRLFLKKRRLASGNAQPKWIEHTASFFPIFLLVLVLRSFLIEPFRIPSGSLQPSLLIGDFVAVNKFAYGVKLPVTDTKVIPVGEPRVGDVAVFKWPPNPKFDYIKRIVGVPGDTVKYENKVLTVNGQQAKQTFIEYTKDREENGMTWTVKKYKEDLVGTVHDIYIRPDVPAFDFEVVVPKGYYLAMGDNRDGSSDSRYWGFVPEENLRGKAFMVWMSWNSFSGFPIRWSRIGSMITNGKA